MPIQSVSGCGSRYIRAYIAPSSKICTYRHDSRLCRVMSAEEWEILRLSLKVAFFSVLGSIPLALGVAVLLARVRFFGKSVFDAAIHLPLVLPPVVVGYFLLLLFGRKGVL